MIWEEAPEWSGGGNGKQVTRTRDRALADEADQRGAGSIAESEGGTHCDGVLVSVVWELLRRRSISRGLVRNSMGPVVSEPT